MRQIKKDIYIEKNVQENEIDNITEENTISPNKRDNSKKKKFTIFGFTVTKLLAYFIIYSIIGFVIETIFGLLTKGALESRKSFLYGPFCGIYGLGAVIMILGLQKFKKNNYTLFIRRICYRIYNRVYSKSNRRIIV